jgi:hypothetical protein
MYRYVPILKTKQGELKGLAQVDALLISNMTPLFELLPDLFNQTKTRPDSDSIMAHVVRSLNMAWPHPFPFFLDGGSLPPGLLQWLPAISRTVAVAGMMPISVTGPERTLEYQEAVRQTRQLTNGDLCFRVQAGSRSMADTNNGIDGLLRMHSIMPQNVHLVFDLHTVSPLMFGASQTVANLVNGIASLHEWKTFTIAGTGYPETLTIQAQSAGLLPRNTWQLWSQMIREARLVRVPAFGDYTINSAVPFEFEPYMQVSAKIRYTTNEDWLVIKGRSTRVSGFEQFHELAQQLVERGEYCGPNYSAGDLYINECANRREGPGNSTVWVQVGVNHHLTFVLRQLASLHAP